MKTDPLRCAKATEADLRAVFAIRANCAADLKARFGAGHWATSPAIKTLANHLETKNLFVVRASNTIVATFTLSLKRPPFFQLKQFADPKASAAYLTGLAVEPSAQKQGIGRFCLGCADQAARKLKCAAIRFDAYDAPAGVAEFYLRCGYVMRHRSIVMGVPLVFFEKVLN
jgi:GNAT superfamily N-acetyltransferase